MRREIYGYLTVVAAASMWGFGGVAMKLLLYQAVSPFLLAKMRMTLASVILVVGLLVFDRRLLALPRREWGYMTLLGIGMAACQFFYIFSVSRINVATAVFLEYLGPVFMAAYVILWEKVRLGWRGLGAVALATMGGLFIMLSAGGFGGSPAGVVSGLAAAVAMAASTIYARRGVRLYPPVTVLTYSLVAGALLWWLILPGGWDFDASGATQWLLLLYIAVFATVLPQLLFYTGLRFIPPTNAGVTSCLEPVVAAASAYFVLGENMGPVQIFGGSLVIVAVVLLQSAPAESEEVRTEA